MPPDASAPRPDPRTPDRGLTDARPDARLEARLSVYAHHAAVVAEQAAALAAGDVDRAAALDEARVRAAEHFTELQAVEAPAASGGPGGSFRAALDTALAELAHQGAVDVALAQRLVALRDAVVRGAAWADASGDGSSSPAGGPPLALPAPAVLPATAPLEGALVAARAAGVGGLLGKHYPGRGPDWSHVLGAGDVDPSGPTDAPRLDVRF